MYEIYKLHTPSRLQNRYPKRCADERPAGTVRHESKLENICITVENISVLS